MTSAAERAKRYRRRKRLGLNVYQVELDQWQLRQLHEAGLIEPEADPEQIAEQIGFAIEELLARHNVTG